MDWASRVVNVDNNGLDVIGSGGISVSTGTITAGASDEIVIDGPNKRIDIGTGILLDGNLSKITVGNAAPNIEIDGANKIIQSSNFNAGPTGAAGFKLDGVAGSIEAIDGTFWGKLKTVMFEADEVNVVNGDLVLTDATKLTEDLDDSETGVDVVDGSVLSVDDLLMVGTSSEVMEVDSVDGNTLTVTRGARTGHGATTHNKQEVIYKVGVANGTHDWLELLGSTGPMINVKHSSDDGSNITFSSYVTLHKDAYLLLGTGNDIARMDAGDATYRLWAGNAVAASAPFRVGKNGALTATSATITGDITANTGYIGGTDGWTVAAKTLTGAADSKIMSGILESSDWGESAGSQLDLVNKTLTFGGSVDYKFKVLANGSLIASNVDISTTSGSFNVQIGGGNVGIYWDETEIGSLTAFNSHQLGIWIESGNDFGIARAGLGAFPAELARFTVSGSSPNQEAQFFLNPIGFADKVRVSFNAGPTPSHTLELLEAIDNQIAIKYATNTYAEIGCDSSGNLVLHPYSGNAVIPGDISTDLGESSNKFRDVYLSGDISVDGTVDGVDMSKTVMSKTFLISAPNQSDTWAQWTLEQDITVLRMSVCLATAVTPAGGPTDYLIFQLSDGTTGYEVKFSDAGAKDYLEKSEPDQDYAQGAAMSLKTIKSGSVTGGADATVGIQYKPN